MPGGKTHDLITAALAVPAFAGTFAVTRNVPVSAVVAAAFLFGGLMFGPDLDTVSKQYSRWSIFRFIWYPYRKVLPHRSRLSHGLVSGTILRLIYFMGAVTLVAFLTAILVAAYFDSRVPGLLTFSHTWREVGVFARKYLGQELLVAGVAGLWLGAASHTFTDLIGTYIRTGHRSKLF
jgi:uncharacterized metal-binding protein